MSVKWTAGLLLALLILAVIGSFPGIYWTSADTCLVCRATYAKNELIGIPLEKIVPNEYSTSVAASDKNHRHQWRYCGHRSSRALFGGYACAKGREATIWHLPVEIQAKYSKLVSADELAASLKLIDSVNRDVAEAEVVRIWRVVEESEE